ncbi:MOS1T transposase, partial [Pseudoatta argentina]
MSKFLPNKVYLRGILLHYFIQKKSPAEAHRILVQTYGDNALSDPTCRDWYRRFKNNDFQLEDKERSGAPNKFQDKELKQLLDEDPSQTLSELGKILQVDESTVSKRLKGLGMIQKRGHWVPYELKPREKKRFFASHRIVTGDEKWIHYDDPKRRKSWGKPDHASTSSAKPNIHGSKLLQLMRLSRALKEKRPLYAQRHDKVILLHDNARPHVAKPVKTYLETLKWEVHFPYCLKLKTFIRLKMFLKKTYPHLTQKYDYSSGLFVPVAESITLEFKRLTYEALTSVVSQGAGTKPRIARLVVQIPEETERTGSEVERG